MGEVAGQGRTVLFVSHNMAAVESLCDSAIVLKNGAINYSGDVSRSIQQYIQNLASELSTPLKERRDRQGNGSFRFIDFSIRNAQGMNVSSVSSGDDIGFALGYESESEVQMDKVEIAISVSNIFGQKLCTFYSSFSGDQFQGKSNKGIYVCNITRFPLAHGTYKINLWSATHGVIIDWIIEAASFDVIEGDFFGTGKMPDVNVHGPFLVDHSWRHQSFIMEI